MKPIPISAAQSIAEAFGYDQVVIIARAVGEGGGEHVTTFGKTAPNSSVAASIGEFLKHKVMGWPEGPCDEDIRYQAFVSALEDILDVVESKNRTGEDWLAPSSRLAKIEAIATAMLLEARGGPKRVR